MLRTTVVLTASTVLLGAGAACAGGPLQLACAPPFTKDASATSLAKAFGKKNVRTRTLDGPEGSTFEGTEIYPDDPKRRLVVAWIDEKKHRRPSTVFIEGESTWTGPAGVRLGSTLAELAALNGEPFTVLGFGWDYGGGASFPKGALSSIAGGCVLNVTLQPAEDGTQSAEILGDKEFSSDNPLIEAAKPAVVEVRIGYPTEE